VQVQVLELEVLRFKPDVLMYFAHSGANRLLTNSFVSVVKRGVDKLPYDYLKSVVERAGVNEDSSTDVIRNKLSPFAEELKRWSYERIVATCRENGIRPVWVYLPRTGQRQVKDNPEYKAQVSMARSFGFVTMTLDGVYGDYPQHELALAAWDEHPNVLGHQLIAERLYTVFMENREQNLGAENKPLAHSTH